jgi:hypothetical protein
VPIRSRYIPDLAKMALAVSSSWAMSCARGKSRFNQGVVARLYVESLHLLCTVLAQFSVPSFSDDAQITSPSKNDLRHRDSLSMWDGWDFRESESPRLMIL